MIKNIFYALARIFAIVFALGELGFLKVRMASYSEAVLGFIQQRKDILNPLLLVLFLGNIGVGCPRPATYMILGQIGVVGDVFYGWLLRDGKHKKWILCSVWRKVKLHMNKMS